MSTLDEICVRDVVTVDAFTGVVEAARTMRDQHVGCLVVVRETDSNGGGKVPIGILTDRDMVVGLLAQKLDDVPSLVVGDVMSSEPVTIGMGANPTSAIRVMRRHGIRRLPVVDDKGFLRGILTLDDVLAKVAQQLSELAQILERSQRVERERRGPGIEPGWASETGP